MPWRRQPGCVRVRDTLAQALAGFAGSEACTDAVADAGANVLTILTHIQAENPDAKILLLNQYNPTATWITPWCLPWSGPLTPASTG